MSELIKCPEPGFYPRVPFDEYCQWQAMNGSTLCTGVLGDGTVSMKHLLASIEGRIHRKQSQAMTDGRAIHTRLLEPKEFASRYRIAGLCASILKNGDRAGQECGNPGLAKVGLFWKCGQHYKGTAESLPDNVISKKMAAKLEAMVKAIAEHPVIKLFRHSGGVEVSLVWDQVVRFRIGDKEHEETIRMKGRLDKLILDSEVIPDAIADIKKTGRGRHTDFIFGKAIQEYNYDLKAGCYMAGVKNLTGKTVNFIWTAIEDDEPYDCNPINADNETRVIGSYKFDLLLSEYAKSLRTGIWPGVSDDIAEGGLNKWAKRLFREREGK